MAAAALGLFLAEPASLASAASPKQEVAEVLMARELAGVYLVRIDRGSLVRVPAWLQGGDVNCFVVYEATLLDHLGGERIPGRVRFSSFRNLGVGGDYVIVLRGGTDLRGIPPAGDQILDSPRAAPPYCVRRVKGVYLEDTDIFEVVRDDAKAYGHAVLNSLIYKPTIGVVDIDRREVGVLLEDLSRLLAQQGAEEWVPLEAESRAALR
jgi:hypothetical protein